MIESDVSGPEPDSRRQSAAMLLSSIGAAVAGAGLGMMVVSTPIELKWSVLGVGIVAHVAGMIGRRRLQLAHSYQFAWWEQVGYWLCWSAIAGLAVYATGYVVWAPR